MINFVLLNLGYYYTIFIILNKKYLLFFINKFIFQKRKKNKIIKVDSWIIVNLKQNNKEKLLPIAKFIYNNAKNINIDNILLEQNFKYYIYIIF